MSNKGQKTKEAPAAKIPKALRKPKNQPYHYPTAEFIAGLIIGGTLTTCGSMGDSVTVAYGPVKDRHGKATHDIRFKIGTQLVLADMLFAQGLVEMYDWVWEDAVFDSDGVVHCYVRPNEEQYTKMDPREMTESEINKTCRANEIG